MNRVRLVLCAALALTAAMAVARPDAASGDTVSPATAKLLQAVTQRDRAVTPGTPLRSEGGTNYGTPSPEMRTAYQEREVARMKEDRYRSEHVKAVYDLQYVGSWVILVLVIAVVGAGLVFSLMQARIALRSIERGIRTADAAAGAPEAVPDLGGHIIIKTTGIEVTSSVLGTITLVISIAFLWLYLQDVYPVVPEQAAQPTSTVTR